MASIDRGSSRTGFDGRRRGLGRTVAVAVLLIALPASALPPRERAIEQIPELMGRILESQEEIRATESEIEPRIQRLDQKLASARENIEAASSEEQAAEALTDYVEAYATRLDEQQSGLDAIHGSVVRMRADARDLAAAADAARGSEAESAAEQRAFFAEQFQGVASATAELAERLERGSEAATAGAVLHASWATHGSLGVPVPELGPDGARSFARKVEGLYARFQARTNQLVAERQAVRRLLDLLIERQLARRLDELFEGYDGQGIGALLATDQGSDDWRDLGGLVARTLGLPHRGQTPLPERASLDRLDHFARGAHRE